MDTSQQTKSSKPQLQPKIKIFQSLQKHLAMSGISSEMALQPNPFNRRISMSLIVLCMGVIFIFKFFFFEAKTMIEYTQSSYMGSVSVVIIFLLFILILKVKKLFEFFNDFENLVNTSKNNDKY